MVSHKPGDAALCAIGHRMLGSTLWAEDELQVESRQNHQHGQYISDTLQIGEFESSAKGAQRLNQIPPRLLLMSTGWDWPQLRPGHLCLAFGMPPVSTTHQMDGSHGPASAELLSCQLVARVPWPTVACVSMLVLTHI